MEPWRVDQGPDNDVGLVPLATALTSNVAGVVP